MILLGFGRQEFLPPPPRMTMIGTKWIFCLGLIPALAVPARAQVPVASEEKALQAVHEKVLLAHKLPATGPGLLTFFRARTLSKEQVEQIQALIEKLHAPDYASRAYAEAELSGRFPLVRSILQEALRKDYPLEACRRLEVLLRNHPEGNEPALVQAAAFLLARQKPASAAQALLDYLPFAGNPRVVQGVREALPRVALVGGEPDPSLRAALTDPHPLKRSAAAEAFVRAGGVKRKPLIEGLLNDEDKLVRWPLLKALVEVGDREAVPLLIALLNQLDREDAYRTEDLLYRIAGDNAPTICLAPGQPIENVQKAWLQWWDKNQYKVDLAKLSEEPPHQGNTLITQMIPEKGLSGKVMEIGPDKEVLWEFGGLKYPVDARIIGKERVLVAEYLNRRVTERDFKGNILWEKHVELPLNCQRLPNGHTFIASRKQLVIVDREGREVFTFFAPSTGIAAAHRLRDGQILLVDVAGTLHHLDPEGKEINAFKVGQLYTLGCNIEVLPGGRILVPAYRENRIVEYNLEGKVLWQAAFPSPVSVAPLPGGNVLVVGLARTRVVELDRAGREVWALDLSSRPWRARKR